MAMLLLTIAALVTTLLLSPASTAAPIEYSTMGISYAPDSALVINEAETQLFRAPLCVGRYVNKWSFIAKVYMMNVPWDALEVGDDSWLRIRVSNGPEFTKIVRDNEREAKAAGGSPEPFTTKFTYSRDTWGSDDIYIEITASQGNPTFQYGLELVASAPDIDVPDGMLTATEEAGTKGPREAQVLEQIASPMSSMLTSGDTGQYEIPFCFEDEYDQRTLTVTTLVPESISKKPGGVASFLCTYAMMKNKICWRSLVIQRGAKFYDPSGAKVNTVTPTVPKDEYGPIYLLVLAQGDYHDKVKFTITTKLRNPPIDPLKLTGNSEKDLHSVLSYLKTSYEEKAAPLDLDFDTDELKEEL